MKKSLLALTLLGLSTSAVADRFDVNVNVNGSRLKNCREKVRSLKAENNILQSSLDSVSSDLSTCRANRGGNSRDLRRRLREANETIGLNNETINRLENTIDRKNDKISDLRLEIQDLRDQLNPLPPAFDLAASIRACGKINNAVYARECTQYARQFEIQAPVIKSCSKISNTFYAKECVKNAGKFGGDEFQVRECTQIQNAVYANECVGYASKGNVDASVVQSCVQSTSNTFYQKECVRGMMNN